MQKLGHEAKSIDQLHEELLFLVDRGDLGTVSEALGKLVKAKRVGSRLEDVWNKANLPYKIRLYFAISP
jgi:hypothetical protein